MIEHRQPGKDAEKAVHDEPAAMCLGLGVEDRGEREDAFDQPVPAEQAHEHDHRGAGRGQHVKADGNTENALEEDEPPGNGRLGLKSAGISLHIIFDGYGLLGVEADGAGGLTGAGPGTTASSNVRT